MKCCKCKESINDGATKCHHCRSWQSRTGELSKGTENVFIGIFSSVILSVLILFTNDYAEESFSELDSTARFIVLSEYAKETKTDHYGDYRVNLLNYYRLKTRYNEIIASARNEVFPKVYNCIIDKGIKCNDVNVTKDEDKLIFSFNENISEDGIMFLGKLTMDRKMTQGYQYGKNKLITYLRTDA